ncbi:MAG: hypothetical protein NTY12_04935 [Candidatus Falkowbacteria bacterium]|nr:hypothetical protein [Candidatus Falkowbacteria bacterium]
MPSLSKKDKKYFLIIILLTLVHNLIVFPAQAAEDYTIATIETSKSKQLLIKKPGTNNISHFEKIKSNKQEILPKAVKSFKLAKDDKINQDNGKDFKIASLDDDEALPDNKGLKMVSLTAYNSEVGQTDSDPCTTANGFNLCSNGKEDSVAANFLPFGTKIMIPDLFGDRVFVVRDRMNKRFSNRVDVWMLKRSDALKFGVRHAQIVILEN